MIEKKEKKNWLRVRKKRKDMRSRTGTEMYRFNINAILQILHLY